MNKTPLNIPKSEYSLAIEKDSSKFILASRIFFVLAILTSLPTVFACVFWTQTQSLLAQTGFFGFFTLTIFFIGIWIGLNEAPKLISPNRHIPSELSTNVKRFRQKHPNPTAFIMMDFGKTQQHQEITVSIRNTLAKAGIEGLRADDNDYHSDLYQNIEIYMQGCDFGVAVFEQIEEKVFNPNVAFEVGYMLALGKPVCLLKDADLAVLPADFIGKLYRSFDTKDIPATIDNELSKWLASWKNSS